MEFNELEINTLEETMDYLRDAGEMDGLFARDCVDLYDLQLLITTLKGD